MRTELKLYRVLGVSSYGEIKMIDYFFSHSDGFGGVTGTSFDFVSPDMIDDMNDLETVIDSYGYLWNDAVADESTTDSQADYIQSIIDSEILYGDSLYLGQDTSDLDRLENCKPLLEKYNLDEVWDAEKGTFSCSGGGRMFSSDDDRLETYLDNPINEALHLLVMKFEAGRVTIDQVEQFLIDNNIEYKKVTR